MVGGKSVNNFSIKPFKKNTRDILNILAVIFEGFILLGFSLFYFLFSIFNDNVNFGNGYQYNYLYSDYYTNLDSNNIYFDNTKIVYINYLKQYELITYSNVRLDSAVVKHIKQYDCDDEYLVFNYVKKQKKGKSKYYGIVHITKKEEFIDLTEKEYIKLRDKLGISYFTDVTIIPQFVTKEIIFINLIVIPLLFILRQVNKRNNKKIFILYRFYRFTLKFYVLHFVLYLLTFLAI